MRPFPTVWLPSSAPIAVHLPAGSAISAVPSPRLKAQKISSSPLRLKVATSPVALMSPIAPVRSTGCARRNASAAVGEKS